MRIFLLLAAILVVGLIVVAFFLMPSGDGGGGFSFGFSGNSGREVRVQDVSREQLIEVVSAPGEIEPNVKVDVSAEVSARIIALPFREGEAVKAGDVIIRLDAREFEARLESSMARRDAQRYQLQSEQSRIAGPMSSLDNARSFLQRQETLFSSGDISRQTLDDARNRVSELAAQVEAAKLSISVLESSLAAAEAEIDQAKKALDRTIMRSPIDGVITILNAEVGELVMVGTMNNPGTVIMTIADLGKMRLNARIAESDIARVAEHQPAIVRINAYPNEEFEGFVERIALQRSLDRDGSGYFKTEVQLVLNGRRIYSGLAANVDIEIAKHEGITVPSQAVIDVKLADLPTRLFNDSLIDRSRRTLTAVYRVVDFKAVLTPVHVGPSNLSETIISNGLAANDKVVIGPYKSLDKLDDGAQVMIEEVPNTTEELDEIAEDSGEVDPSADIGSVEETVVETRDSA